MAQQRRKRGASGSLPELDPIPGTGRFKQFQGQKQQQQHAYPSSVPAWARPVASGNSSNKASPSSSRPRSPANEALDDASDGEILALSAGCQPDSVYREALSWSRYTARTYLVKSLEWESPILANLQTSARSPFWDAYFIWSSIFGTHSAFMVGLPIFWWFGYASQGLGMVNILAAGVYLSSFLKDFFCVPRPYTPPVERLSISSHGLEYGFPSTHSTNAVSVSLYLAQIYLQSCSTGEEYSLTSSVVLSVCALYAVSVVLGRLYCGMHSMVDCLAGTLLGTAIWYSYYRLTPAFMAFLTNGSIVPSFIVPICLFLVSVHPEPVDDCPCFEDAIAFVAVSAGVSLGQWTLSTYKLRAYQTLGLAPFARQNDVTGTAIWFGAALAKIAVGVGSVLVWRIVAKRILYTILPPLFKLFQPIISLPRKGYETASGYQQIEDTKPMQPVPSVLDFTTLSASPSKGSVPSLAVHTPDTRASSPAPSPIEDNGLLNVIGTASARPGQGKMKQSEKRTLAETANGPTKAKPKIRALYQVRYDVDVLTKVGVYAGIGYLVVIPLPILFKWIGLDV